MVNSVGMRVNVRHNDVIRKLRIYIVDLTLLCAAVLLVNSTILYNLRYVLKMNVYIVNYEMK